MILLIRSLSQLISALQQDVILNVNHIERRKTGSRETLIFTQENGNTSEVELHESTVEILPEN